MSRRRRLVSALLRLLQRGVVLMTADDVCFWEPEDIQVSCYEYTVVVGPDGEERDEVVLKLSDSDTGDMVTIMGKADELSVLAKRITDAVTKPDRQPWP